MKQTNKKGYVAIVYELELGAKPTGICLGFFINQHK